MPHYYIITREHRCAMICSLGCWLECVTMPILNLEEFYNKLINTKT